MIFHASILGSFFFPSFNCGRSGSDYFKTGLLKILVPTADFQIERAGGSVSEGTKASRYTQGSESDPTALPRSLLLCVATGIKAPEVSSVSPLLPLPPAAVGITVFRFLWGSLSSQDKADEHSRKRQSLGTPVALLEPAFLAQSPACSSSFWMFRAQLHPCPCPILQIQLLPGDSVGCTPERKVPGLPGETPSAGLQLHSEPILRSVLHLLPHQDAQALGSPPAKLALDMS